jgi:hypothetical protein
MLIGKKLYFYLKIKLYFFSEWIKTIRYYSNMKFMIFDTIFNIIYFFINPFRTSRKFLEKKFIKKIYDYGETPLTQMEKIVNNFGIQSTSKILELGSGRGKISFWLNFFYKCNVTAIEQIPTFVNIANFLKKIFMMKNLSFLCENFFNREFKDFDIIYLYGTTLSDEKIQKLISKFGKLSSSVKIITISYSLDEYDDNFICEKKLDVIFPWGQTTAYLNILKKD